VQDLRIHGVFAPGKLEALTSELARLSTLEQVVRWGLASKPSREVVNVVVQDEYTHDIVLAGPDGIYLCFDTT
jgi:hypothetical protein